MALFVRQRLREIGTCRQQLVEERLITDVTRQRELELLGAALHQHREDLVMPELARNHVRGLVAAKRPDVDRTAGACVLHGEVLGRNPRANGRGISIQMSAHQLGGAECGGHEDVGGAAARHEVAGDILAVAYHPLRRCGLVVDVACVDNGTVLQQVSRDLDGGRKVQRGLSIAATRMHQLRIGGNKSVQPLEHPEPSRRVCVNRCAALDEEGCKRRLAAIEDAEAARPPIAAGVDVGSVSQQEIDHLPILPLHRRHQHRRAEGPAWRGIIQPRAQLRMLCQQLRGAWSVVGGNGAGERCEHRI